MPFGIVSRSLCSETSHLHLVFKLRVVSDDVGDITSVPSAKMHSGKCGNLFKSEDCFLEDLNISHCASSHQLMQSNPIVRLLESDK